MATHKEIERRFIGKIRKEAIIFFIGGIIAIIFGYYSTLIVYAMGWIVFATILILLGGVGAVLVGIYQFIKPKSSNSYHCWDHYGCEDRIIPEIDHLIQTNEGNLIITPSWIIDKGSYLFAKPIDINFIYHTFNKKDPTKSTFHIHTNFGIKLSDILSSDQTYNDRLYANFNFLCKNAIFGYQDKLPDLWSKDPKNFYESVKKINNGKQYFTTNLPTEQQEAQKEAQLNQREKEKTQESWLNFFTSWRTLSILIGISLISGLLGFLFNEPKLNVIPFLFGIYCGFVILIKILQSIPKLVRKLINSW